MRVLAIDTETDLMGPGNVNPTLVCVTAAWLPDGEETVETVLFPHCQEGLEEFLLAALTDPEVLIVGHRISFDLAVIAQAFPDLTTPIFAKLEQQQITDTRLREKLLDLSTHGSLDSIKLLDGSTKRLSYSLADLALKYLGVDRSAEKSGEPDSWRLNYASLLGKQFNEYPAAAVEYACTDASDTLLIYLAQERHARDNPPAQMTNDTFHTAADFALRVMTCIGICVDQHKVDEVRAMLDEQLAPEKLNLLTESGVLRAPQPPRPHKGKKNEARYAEAVDDAVERLLACEWTEADWLEYFSRIGVRMTKPVEESVNTTLLKERVVAACAKASVDIQLSDTGAEKFGQATISTGKFAEVVAIHEAAVEAAERAKGRIAEIESWGTDNPGTAEQMAQLIEEQRAAAAYAERHPVNYVSTNEDMISQVADHDPVLGQYSHRQGLQKLLTTYIKPIDGQSTIHPEFDALKETSRTSSYGGKLYPSINGQNVPPIVRPCFIAREGHVWCSVDYSAIELAAFGQQTYELFGESVHRDLINQDVDLHAYLGAQLARRFAADHPCTPRSEDPLQAYQEFKALKGGTEEEVAFYEHWRKFAKPVGLGFPGGMGPATMVTLARTAYDIIIDEEMAYEMREVWFATYPEAKKYFQWVNRECIDPNNYEVDEGGRKSYKYRYWSPMGTLRAGATYCAAANGAGLQTRTAEGAKGAVFDVVRACMDESVGSILFGCLPVLFIHDEIILELPEGDTTHDMAYEMARVMVDSMSALMPDVTVRAKPALMYRWDKKAEDVHDENGRLQVWQPKADKKAA